MPRKSSLAARLGLLVLATRAAGLNGQGVITTVAGADAFAAPVDGVPAVSLPLREEFSPAIAVDAAGNVYFSGQQVCQVYKITPAGIATTVAGNGICGFFGSGDGGPARRAGVSARAIAVDSAGTLYIAEFDRIRRVGNDGKIATWIGGVRVTTAPNALSFDSRGNLYYIDSEDRSIRRVDPSGRVAIVAGNGQQGNCATGARATDMPFASRSLAVDQAGNLYVNMIGSFVVCKVAPDGSVTKLPGALRSESGLAVAANGDLLLSNPFDPAVYRLTEAGTISIAAGVPNQQGAGAGDGGPAIRAHVCASSLAASPDGGFYVWDSCARRLRRVDGSGAIGAFAGASLPSTGTNALSPLGGPRQVAADSQRNTYIATETRVFKVTPAGLLTLVAGNGESPTTSAGSGSLTGRRAVQAALRIYDIAVNARDELLILNFGSQIFRVEADGTLQSVAGDGFGPSSGDDGPATAARVFNVSAIDVGADGSIYLAQGLEHRVRRIRADGVIVKFAGTGTAGANGVGGPATSAQLYFPTAIAADGLGNVYIGETGGPRYLNGGVAANRVRVVGSDGVLRARAELPTFEALAADGAGNLYASLFNSAQVVRVDTAGKVTPWAGGSNPGGIGDGLLATSARLQGPTDVAVDAAGNVLVVDSQNERVRAVLASPPSFRLSVSRLDFRAASRGRVSRVQAVVVSSPVQGLEFSVSVPADARWCRVSVAAGQMPRLADVSVDPAGLQPGVYETLVTVRSAAASPATATLRVVATIDAAVAPSLSASADNLSFTVPRSAPSRPQPLVLSNDGSGSMTFKATVKTRRGAWLSVSPDQGTVVAGAPVVLSVIANPAGFEPGTYTGSIELEAAPAGRAISIPVVLTVSRLESAILLSQSGLSYLAVAGGGQLPPQDFSVLNLGTGRMGWTAAFSPLTGGNWLRLSTLAGTSGNGPAESVSVEARIDQTGLPLGRYFGQITVSAAGAANSPQVVTVVLDVVTPEESPGPILRPSQLRFGDNVEPGASATSSIDVLIYNPNAVPVTYSSTRSSELSQPGGFDLVVVAPGSGTVQPGRPSLMTVQPRFLRDTTGTLGLQFSDGNVRAISVQLGAAALNRGIRGAEGCSATGLAPVFLAIGQGPTLPAGAPSAVVAEIKDSCGQPLTRPGSAVVTFSNGDAPLVLEPVQDGRWHGTWQARSGSAAGIGIRIDAQDPVRGLRGTAEANTDLRGETGPPSVSTAGIVSAAQGVAFAPVAPGAMITLFGERLAESQAQSDTLPLPTRLGSVEVLMAGQRLPLLFANAAQINAIVPAELEPNTRHQLIVRRGNTYSQPVAVNTAAAQPGAFTSDGRRAIALVYRGTESFLASVANPARAGDTLVLYCAGLGAVTPAVKTGEAALASPLSRTVAEVRATIGTVNVPVDFAGLVPGYPGLYQLNLRIPSGLAASDNTPLVIETLGQESPVAVISVR